MTTMELLGRAREARAAMALAGTERKNAALLAMAESLERGAGEILAANRADLAAAEGTISPVMMDLYGLDQPLFFQYLNLQLKEGYRSHTGGVTVHWDGTITQELTEDQAAWNRNHWLLQYDLMFGGEYALGRMGLDLGGE